MASMRGKRRVDAIMQRRVARVWQTARMAWSVRSVVWVNPTRPFRSPECIPPSSTPTI